MSKRTLFLIFALFIITLVLLMMALYKPSNPKPVQTVTAPKEIIEQTTLSFGELSIVTSSSATALSYSLPIQITTGKNKVTAVQLELQYDPKILSNVSVNAGPFFNNPDVLLNQIDSKTGRISYAFGVGLTEQGIVGQGVVANITFEAKSGKTTQTAILFLPKTLVTGEGVSQSVLKATNNAAFTVGITPATTSGNSSPSPQ